MEDKYICTFLLHALGDTIGFNNSDWEFNYSKESDLFTVIELICEFIDFGGVNGIDLKDWIISDDTLYHMAIAKTILKYKTFDDAFILLAKNNLVRMHNKMIDEEKKGINRHPGKITEYYIQKFTETEDGRTLQYRTETGGNGAAMRNLCIGLAFYKESDIDDLINISINLSKLTHNSALGYLAGFTSAYFVSLALREININKWVYMLLDILDSETIKSHINDKNNVEYSDYINYIGFWKKYLDTRFNDGKPIKTRSTSNVIYRIKYYYENFVKDTRADFIGGSGYCAMIMAYDALIDCDGKWEKLIFYAMLHPGDSDTIGAIAGGIYGIMYGYGDVPEKMLCCIEEKEQLLLLGKKFYKKFYN